MKWEFWDPFTDHLPAQGNKDNSLLNTKFVQIPIRIGYHGPESPKVIMAIGTWKSNIILLAPSFCRPLRSEEPSQDPPKKKVSLSLMWLFCSAQFPWSDPECFCHREWDTITSNKFRSVTLSDVSDIFLKWS